MSEHYKTYSAIFPIIMKTTNGITKILLSRRKNTGYQDGKLDIAGGGHVDEGETAQYAVMRECKEELGIDVQIDGLSFAHLCHRFSNRVYYDIYFIVRQFNGIPIIMEPDKCSELDWFAIDNLPNDIIECRRIALQSIINECFYSERFEECVDVNQINHHAK